MNSKRYADYLGEDATGDFSNIEVASGSRSLKDFFEGPCYHFLRFSTFEPNPLPGPFPERFEPDISLIMARRSR